MRPNELPDQISDPEQIPHIWRQLREENDRGHDDFDCDDYESHFENTD